MKKLSNTLLCGDCKDKMKKMEESSVDAIVTDPPYGLEFMGKEWDKLYPNKGKWTGKKHEPTIETKDDTPQHRSAIKQPAYLKRCVKCDGNSAGEWNRCTCEIPDFRIPSKIYYLQQEWHYQWATEAFRVLKPGGYMAVFAGARTSHRLACALEDAGFEIRDTISWVYGSGFPKSLDISKSIDKMKWAEREKVRDYNPRNPKSIQSGHNIEGGDRPCLKRAREVGFHEMDDNNPITEEAKKWNGWGTGLKPAHEPIILCRKPLSEGNVAENVLKYGTGGLNIDESRISITNNEKEKLQKRYESPLTDIGGGSYKEGYKPATMEGYEFSSEKGRWPANFILSHHPECVMRGAKRVKGDKNTPRNRITLNNPYMQGKSNPKIKNAPSGYADSNGFETVEDWKCHPDCPIRLLDEQSLDGGMHSAGHSKFGQRDISGKGRGAFSLHGKGAHRFGDLGGASRFFKCFEPEVVPFFYCAKASRAERNKGLEDCEEKKRTVRWKGGKGDDWNNIEMTTKNFHPTVKPIKLMRYLCKLIAPPHGIILDPFMGSGTTGIACIQEDFDFIGIENEKDYFEIAKKRNEYAKKHKRWTLKYFC